MLCSTSQSAELDRLSPLPIDINLPFRTIQALFPSQSCCSRTKSSNQVTYVQNFGFEQCTIKPRCLHRRLLTIHKVKIRDHVVVFVAEFFPHLGHDDLTFFKGPAQKAREKPECIRLYTLQHVFKLIEPKLFQLLVFRPNAHRDLGLDQ